MNIPISNFFVPFYISTIFIQLGVLLIAFWLISGHSYRHPWKIFAYGFACMAFAAAQKSLLSALASGLSRLVNRSPETEQFIASLPMSITVVEIATAAVGGSLVAASIVLKSQILHNENKFSKDALVKKLTKDSANLEAEINLQNRLLEMESLGCAEFNKAIHCMKKDLSSLKESKLRIDIALDEAKSKCDELKKI